MSEYKDKKTVFNRNQKEEFKSSGSGRANQQTQSGTHLVNLQKGAKSIPKMPKRQKKG
jgi:hypothetical protein